MIVDIVLRRLVVQRHVAHQIRRLDGEGLDPLPVDQQLQVVRLAQALDVLVAVTREPDRELVDAVCREVPGRKDAAPSADGQTLDVLLLGQIGIRTEGDPGRLARPPHREPADLLRRADVSVEQSRREIADGHVVEAEARGVARQQSRGIDLQREQVADRVVVLGAVQPAEGLRAARIGRLGSDAVEFRLEGRECLDIGAVVRAAPARRRHLPRAQLAGHLLPGRAVAAGVLLDQGVEFKARRLEAAVVAAQAVARDEDAVRRVGVERRGGCRPRRRARERRSNCHQKPTQTHATHPNRPWATSRTQSWLAHLQLPG